MISKKSLNSCCALIVTLILCFASMHIMSLFTVSKWVGVGIGGGMFAVMLVLMLVLRKRKFIYAVIVCVNGAASGIALSSLFVFLGRFPAVWHSVCVAAAIEALLIGYCLFTNIEFCRDHFAISIAVYFLVLLGVAITLLVIKTHVAFVLAAMSLIPLLAFLVSLPIYAVDRTEHMQKLAYCSFAALAIIIIVVLIIISQGDGLDGIDFGGGGSAGTGTKRKQNPYDYINITE